MSRTSPYNLFIQALHVTNVALTANKDRSPCKQILSELRKKHAGQNISVVVCSDETSTPRQEFTIRLEGDSFVLAGPDPQPALVWKVPESYLEQVASHPQIYVEHPERLDWSWMHLRVDSAH